MSDDDGLVPLHMACVSGNLDMVKSLCNTGNIETCDKSNYRPIHVACSGGHLGIVEYLHQHGCDIEAPGNSGNRPLHLASEHGRLDVVKYLCNQKCQLNAPNDELWRPIHLACRGGHAEIVRHLYDKFCDKEVYTDHGERPIHLACEHGHLDIVRYLCERKCDIEASTLDNYKPIQLACKHGHIAIVDYLCQQKCNIEVHRQTTDPRFFVPQWSHIEAFITKQLLVQDSSVRNGCHDISKFLLEESPKRQLIKKISNYKEKCDDSCDHSFCLKKYFEKFNSDATLSKGGFGRVFKMRDSELNYTYCMKSIFLEHIKKFQKIRHIEFNINMYREVLYHERIVEHFGSISTEQEIFIFMEFVEGKSLWKHINKKPLPHNKVIQYSKEILEGLKYLHHNNIIHRDIKPQNIMINPEDHVKLCDFGLSCYLEIPNPDYTTNITFCGTYNYIAPECAKGETSLHPVDIWGLGVTIVEMLTGKPPFHTKKGYAVLDHIKELTEVEFEPAQPMSRDMKSFVDQMLSPCPSKRATAEKLLDLISYIVKSSTEEP